ncbi:MAG: hypothetical protein A2Y84_00455 [Candidatus Colwellbacteria bacterium RBG_13_48_8]|uniref:Elongation factor P C-terminal domain-containing protein n=1 Tax=Candidatus Colwellbacteria bacterium RBG_13_48_8 TaxID=1797685 RepID=A0A1G1YX82_9BACT|nr:MAG: hypothetical protein A2Y84_00455 [Candidatus Colwellbacteria bacterium RBG_13_48_8]
MLGINDLKRGLLITVSGEPYQVLTVRHVHMGRGGAVVQSKIKNLITGKIFERSFKPADDFDEAELEKINACFIYARQGEYWFHEVGNPANRFSVAQSVIGEAALFLKPQMEVKALKFAERFINVEMPIKADYRVIEAPPSVRGNTAQGGTKQVVIETGAKVVTPMFIKAGDIIRGNTETSEYV